MLLKARESGNYNVYNTATDGTQQQTYRFIFVWYTALTVNPSIISYGQSALKCKSATSGWRWQINQSMSQLTGAQQLTSTARDRKLKN